MSGPWLRFRLGAPATMRRRGPAFSLQRLVSLASTDLFWREKSGQMDIPIKAKSRLVSIHQRVRFLNRLFYKEGEPI